MRKHIAVFLLTASVFVWGIWCGGQVFNELMVVPKWSASPPETIKAYDEIPQKGGAPFFVLSIRCSSFWQSVRRFLRGNGRGVRENGSRFPRLSRSPFSLR